MILSSSRRYVFVHIHKTGGGAIVAALEPYLSPDDVCLRHSFRRLPRRQRHRHPNLSTLEKHSGAAEIEAAIGADAWEGHFTFAFVRNPIDRAISFYNFCADQHQKRERVAARHAAFYTPMWRAEDPRRWPGIRAFSATGSFSEFIRSPELSRERAFRPQTASVCDANGQLLVDFIGRHESFEADVAVVQRRLELPVTPTPRENVTQSRLVTRATLSADDRAFLTQQFADDFATLGYDD